MKGSTITETAVTQELLDDIVSRILGVVRPLRIVLFGSAARGVIGPHSDLDILWTCRMGHTAGVRHNAYIAPCSAWAYRKMSLSSQKAM